MSRGEEEEKGEMNTCRFVKTIMPLRSLAMYSASCQGVGAEGDEP